jgi:hypothetical protein
MRQKDLDELRLKVREYDPRGPRKPSEVFLVQREEQYEHPSIVAICVDLAVAKAEAEGAARRWDFKLLPWEKVENSGSLGYWSAAVDGPVSELEPRIHYTIRKEAVLNEPTVYPETQTKIPDQFPSSKYGVVCRDHGEQGMQYGEYMDQLSNADALWKCPVCGLDAEFDEGRYESRDN